MTSTFISRQVSNKDAGMECQELKERTRLRRDRQLRENYNDNAPIPLVDRKYGVDQNYYHLEPLEMTDRCSSLSSSSSSSSSSSTDSFPDDYGQRTYCDTRITKPPSASGRESLLATQFDKSSSMGNIRRVVVDSAEADSINHVPPHSYPSSQETAISSVTPAGTLRIVLNESETFFIFGMPEKIDNRESHVGGSYTREDQGEEAGGRYEGRTSAIVSNRRRSYVRTQTSRIPVKSRGTYLPRGESCNRGSIVKNWLMHEHCVPDVKPDRKGTTTVSHRQNLSLALESLVHRRDARCGGLLDRVSVSVSISISRRFRAAALVMERLITNNLYAEPHRRYNGLIRRDPCSFLLTFDYKLKLLWKHECPASRGRPVMSFRWNRVRTTLLAVAYGPNRRDPTRPNDGYLAIWCAKNPSWPALSCTFERTIADVDWSRHRPNLLALGFYDGTLGIIDVSNIVGDGGDPTFRCFGSGATGSPHLHVQWWLADQRFPHSEDIYTAGQNGRVYRYRPNQPDLPCTEIMRISRTDGTERCGARNISQQEANALTISANPAALLLSRHPTRSSVYFVGSEQGCIYRCSIDYFQQHSECFHAHDGAIYSMEFSPFCPEVFLTAGADWCIRLWTEGLNEPLITLRTARSCVRSAVWSPTNSTVIASIVDNEISIWDVESKIHRPTSVTVSSEVATFVKLQFAASGKQLTAADCAGTVHVYDVRDMPFPPYDPSRMLMNAIERALVTKPTLLRKFKSLNAFSSTPL